MNLSDIERALNEYTPIPEPFNGATRVLLSRDAFDAIAPHIHVAFPWGAPTVELRETLPAGHGYGYRKWRAGDDPDQKYIGETIVWALAPKSTEEK